MAKINLGDWTFSAESSNLISLETADTSTGELKLTDANFNLNTNDIQNANTVETEQLTGGVAGDGNSISGVAGDSGEIIIFCAERVGPGDIHTVSNTTFTSVPGNNHEFRSLKAILEESFQNSEIVGRVVGRTYGAPDDSVTIRLAGISETEVTETNGGVTLDSGWVSLTELNRIIIEAKVSTGSADIHRLGYVLGRRIK